MDNLLVLSNHISWRDYDRIMEQVFYEKFGKFLEKKMDEYENTKKQLKQSVKHIIEDPKAMATPARKAKPALALAKRINEFKDLQNSARKADREKEQYERDKKAQKIREVQLKERAERTKREREERAKRVLKNNQIKEAERKEHEEAMRARLAEQKKFAEEQKKLAATPKYERTPAKAMPNVFRSAVKVDHTNMKQIVEDPKAMATPARKAKPALASAKRINEFKDLQNSAKKADREKEQPERFLAFDMAKEKMPEFIAFDTSKADREKEQPEQFITFDMTKEKMPVPSTEENSIVDESSAAYIMAEEKIPIPSTEENYNVDESSAAYEMTKEKIPIPSTEENYNVDDLSSADETDPEDSPRKQIPKWAQKENLAQHIKGLQDAQALERVDRYFGRIHQPAVIDFFQHFKKKYPKRRSSSAIWDSPMSDPTPGFGRFAKMFQQA